jgi:hypothetical protein
MGFFKKTFKNQGMDINEQEAQQSVEKEGSEWMQNQFTTAKSYNDEDFVGGGKTHRDEHASSSQQSETRKQHSSLHRSRQTIRNSSSTPS